MDLQQLIHDYLGQTITDDGFTELVTRLREEELARERFVREAALHGQINALLKNQELGDFLNEFDIVNRTESLSASPQKPEPDLDQLFQASFVNQSEATDDLTLRKVLSVSGYVITQFIRTPKVVRGLASLAALLVVGLVAWSLMPVGVEPAEQPPIATQETPAQAMPVAWLTAESEARWRSDDREVSLAVGKGLYPSQTLTLVDGFAEITTEQGAVAILQAPCTIELINRPNTLRLVRGKLVGICETASSRGFTVRTDHADITDLGTEFGVEAWSDGVQTSVFVGEVTFKTSDSGSRRITHNQTATLTVEDGKRSLIIEPQLVKGYTRRLPRLALITDARINLDGFDIKVVPQGVYEDAKVYTDRDHEINGLNADGIPSFLLGGDLVQMPAHARPDLTPSVGKDLKVEIELSAPADIYLLIDVGTKPEPWLKRDYELTKVKVGKDQWNRGDPGSLGVGPGVSIDRHFLVWKRKQPATGRVVAGQTIQGTMYVIVAVPAGDQ